MDFDSNLERFSLRWSNFNDNMKIGFHDLLRTEDFVDVTIAVEGKLIQAHKMVLSVCSPYFRNIFKANPCQHPVVFLKDVTHKELSGILQFMYLGEVTVQQEELGRFLKTAEALQIKGLTGDNNSCQELVKEMDENHKSPSRSKAKGNDHEKETWGVKKMKMSSVIDGVKGNGRASPVQKTTETMADDESDDLVVCKTENTEVELSDDGSDGVSIKDENVSEPFLQLTESFADDTDDISYSIDTSNSAGTPQDGFNEMKEVTSESFVMAYGNKDLRYLPVLTKNQGLCPVCGRILQHKKNLQTHIADQHSGLFRSWPCQICHKVCKTWSALRVHTNRHHTKLGSTQLVNYPAN